LILVAFLGLTGCGNSNDYDQQFKIPEDKQNETRFTIKFGRVPSVTVTQLLKRNARLIRRLKDDLNVNIIYRFADDYRGIIEGMSNNEYDFVWMGPFSYVLSECYSSTSATYRPLVRPLRRGDDGKLSGDYRGLIFTSRTSSVDSLSDLKGQSVAFVDRRSTSGFLFPMARLIEAGLNPSEDFSYDFLDRHDRVVQEVNLGNYAAGATYENARMQEFGTQETADRNLPVLARTRPIPSSPIAVSSKFAEKHPGVVNRFVDIMTGLHENREGRSILGDLEIARYREASVSDYDEVRTVLKRLQPKLPELTKFCQRSLPGDA
jgi:phosphonate transport system substrate-binding protein